MGLILCRIEEARLRGHVGFAALRLNRPWRPTSVDRSFDRTVSEMKRETLRLARVARMRKSLAVPARHPCKAAREGFVGVGELRQSPEPAQLLGQPCKPLIHQIPPKTAGDEVQVGPGISRPGGERSWQPLTDLIQALRHRSEDGRGLRPTTDGEVEALAATLDAA